MILCVFSSAIVSLAPPSNRTCSSNQRGCLTLLTNEHDPQGVRQPIEAPWDAMQEQTPPKATPSTRTTCRKRIGISIQISMRTKAQAVTIEIIARTFPEELSLASCIPAPACTAKGDGDRSSAAMDAANRPQQVWQNNSQGLESADKQTQSLQKRPSRRWRPPSHRTTHSILEIGQRRQGPTTRH